MKVILAILLAVALFYVYNQKQKISSLEAELEASRSEVVALKKEIAELPTPTGSAPASSRPNARKPVPGHWMWEPKPDNPLAAPPPKKQK